jgi:L-amino acid N-acyltransferase YncA
MEINNYRSRSEFFLGDYTFDQYYLYPSAKKDPWIDLYYNQIERKQKDLRTIFYPDLENATSALFTVVHPEWDEDHFGFRISKISNPFVPAEMPETKTVEILSSILSDANKNGTRVIIARVNGDNLGLIHAMQDLGFRYYETIIWPVSDVDSQDLSTHNVRFFDREKDKVEDIITIAGNFQYQRGHFHCDNRFDKNSVNNMYAKWVKTAILSEKKIAIIKNEDRIAGYFICEIDETLSDATGYHYGRLQSLALDDSFRGKGFGKRLFEGTLALLKNAGCKYVDSGYASKNHLSAKLHSFYGFSSVYEEITMHLWL